jgi:hypothetical protein
MAGEFLPPVVTVLQADVSDVAAKVEEAKALIESLGDINVPINFNVNTASLARARTYAQQMAKALGDVQENIDFGVSLPSLLATDAAIKTLNDVAANTAPIAQGADGAMRLWGTGIRLTNVAIHGLISGFIEWLAVAIPGTVALGAASFVWLQGAANMGDHLMSMYTTTEATANIFGKTTPQILGMGHAMQTAQNEANPDVYQVLGAAINIVRENTGDLAQVGLSVGQVFDTFAAKLVYDFSAAGGAGKTMTGLLSNMEPDLVEFGQILGNMGHGLADFAADMPGAANMLLAFLDGVSKVVSMVGDIPAPIITSVMALHELNTWGSIAVAGLGKLGIATTEVEGSFFGFSRAAGVLRNVVLAVPMALSQMTAGLGGMIGKLGVSAGSDGLVAAGAAVQNFGVDAKSMLADIGPWQGALIALGAAGFGFLADQILTAQTAAQKFDDSINKGIASASNQQALGTIAVSLGKVNAEMAKTVTEGQQVNNMLGGIGKGEVMGSMIEQTRQLAAEQSTLETQFTLTTSHAAQLANTYDTTFVGALALASAAGVKLQNSLTGKNWAIAQIQINDYVRGMMGMGQTVGAVGTDVTALAIQSQLSATKVAQLNQAWDQFMSDLTAGTGDLASVVQSIQNIGQVVGDTKNNLGEAGSISLTTRQFAEALTSFAGNGAQAWTNFDQIVGSTMPNLIDWLRTAGAEGAITGPEFSHDILDMAKSMEAFASKSPAAQAELIGLVDQAGLNIKTWPQLVSLLKDGKYSLDNLGSSVDSTTIKMANMGQVAATLGADVENDFISQMAGAIIKSGSFDGKLQQLISDVQRFGANSPKAHQALSSISSMLQQAGVHGQELHQILQGVQQYIDTMHGTTLTIGVNEEMSYVMGKGHNPAGPPGYAAGSRGARSGWAIVGERGPELMHLRGGEVIIPNHQLRGYADGTGAAGDTILHNHVYLNGKEIFSEVKRMSYEDNFANGNRKSGGRPVGTMVPR